MIHKASDGHEFYHPAQLRRYEEYLKSQRAQKELIDAPGGRAHEHAIKEHGPVREAHYKSEGMGRHRMTFTHADGKTSTSVHPEGHRAWNIGAQAMGFDNPPATFETHQRSKQYPIGPKEENEIRRNDHQESEEE